MKREKVQERIKQQEEERRSIEEKEKDRKIKFMEDWKEKVERKRKQERVQQGWKDLLESVEQWEELLLEQLEASRASGTILNEKEKGLFIGTVPSDRSGELEEIQK